MTKKTTVNKTVYEHENPRITDLDASQWQAPARSERTLNAKQTKIVRAFEEGATPRQLIRRFGIHPYSLALLIGLDRDTALYRDTLADWDNRDMPRHYT